MRVSGLSVTFNNPVDGPDVALCKLGNLTRWNTTFMPPVNQLTGGIGDVAHSRLSDD
jgi:hypothetical protein